MRFSIKIFFSWLILFTVGCDLRYHIPRKHNFLKFNTSEKFDKERKSIGKAAKVGESMGEEEVFLKDTQYIVIESTTKQLSDSIAFKFTHGTSVVGQKMRSGNLKLENIASPLIKYKVKTTAPKDPSALSYTAKMYAIFSGLLLTAAIVLFFVNGGGLAFAAFGLLFGLGFISEKFHWKSPTTPPERPSNPEEDISEKRNLFSKIGRIFFVLSVVFLLITMGLFSAFIGVVSFEFLMILAASFMIAVISFAISLFFNLIGFVIQKIGKKRAGKTEA